MSKTLSLKKNNTENSSNLPWQLLQIGVFLLPILPTWGAILIVISSGVVARGKYNQIIASRLNWALALLSVWLIITCCFAHQPGEAFLGLPNLLPHFGMFACLSAVITTRKQLHRLAWLILIPSALVILLGLGQMGIGLTTPESWQGFLGWVLFAYGYPEGRMSSVFIYTNILAIYLLIVLVLAWGLWIETYKTWRRQRKMGNIAQLVFLNLVIAGGALSLLLTSSRNAWGVAIVAFLTFAFYLGWCWLVWLVSTAVAAIVWASFGVNPGRDWLRKIVPVYFWGRLSDQFYPVRDVGTLRSTQWQFTLQMTQDRPWLGWGLRNFTPIYEQQMNEWLGHPHNLYLMLMAETGIPATVMLLGIVGWISSQAVLLLSQWLKRFGDQSDCITFFAFVVAFASVVLFNLLDVSLYDFRVNTLTWILLAAIWGIRNSDS